jgi:hypothetical protein
LTTVIINGRALVEPQIQALRAALSFADQTGAMVEFPFDPDRLTEVLQMLQPTERQKQEKMLTGMHTDRVNRVLQLAGIAPDHAAPEARKLAEGYVIAGVRNDEAAIRLQRALNANMRGEA